MITNIEFPLVKVKESLTEYSLRYIGDKSFTKLLDNEKLQELTVDKMGRSGVFGLWTLGIHTLYRSLIHCWYTPSSFHHQWHRSCVSPGSTGYFVLAPCERTEFVPI